MFWYKNTDTVDIDARSIGVHNTHGHANRGLSIQIKHNGDRRLLKKADELANLIANFLNEQEPNK